MCPLATWLYDFPVFAIFFNLLTLPVMVLYLSENARIFIFVSIMHLICFIILFPPCLEEMIENTPIPIFNRRFIALIIFSYGLLSVLMYGVCSNLKHYHNQTVESEIKRTKAERQRLFIFNFSDEIRNIINTMLGNLQICLMAELITPTCKEYLKKAKICSDVLLYMISNILDSGKIEIGELEINKRLLNIYQGMLDIWQISYTLIQRRGLEGKIKISKKVPLTLEIDIYRLGQAVFNLISNSVKFTKKGTIQIVVDWYSGLTSPCDKSFDIHPFDDSGVYDKNLALSMNDGKNFVFISPVSDDLNIQSKAENDHDPCGILRIDVLDTGEGIEEEKQGDLFEKYSPALNPEGLGLGLYITREIITKMSGEIRVYSIPKKGTGFVICLPCNKVSDNIQIQLPQQGGADRRADTRLRSVLIVDDDLLGHDILKNYFGRLKIPIAATAVNGLEAFEQYKRLCENKTQPLLVTMDINMPLCNGKLASQMIRKYEKRKHLIPCVIIILSGNSTASEISECMDPLGEVRAQDFLVKPLKYEVLCETIEKYMK
jgi:signal transduction histidine kinase